MTLDSVDGDLERYMTLLSERQELVSSNIANADTPGYKTKDIDFQSALDDLMTQGADVHPSVIDVPGLVVKDDGNNVNLDREARLLSENALRFSVASNLLKSDLQTVKMAIEGGSAQS